ncbi:989_t:CDS:2, partial [Dentiscutata heterogama]
IQLHRKWEEDYLERHAKSSGCKAKEGQRSIYNFFKPTNNQLASSDEEWDSDIYNNMDDDDLLQIDETDEAEEVNDDTLALTILTNNESLSDRQKSKKRLICQGLQSEQISDYIKRTPAQFGGSRRIEVVAREIFPKLFFQKFSRKKLNYDQKQKLNRALYAESTWQIDRNSNAVRAKTCSGIAEKGDICNECRYIRFDKNLYIPKVITKIKTSNGIAKTVRAYLLQ